MIEMKIQKEQAGQRMDKYVLRLLPGMTSSFFYKMLRKKNIVLNGKKAEGKELLKEGDCVGFFFKEETFHTFENPVGKNTEEAVEEYLEAYRSLKGIDILYEDEDVLVLNKPQGILSQKAEPGDMSLNEWMLGYLMHKHIITNESMRLFKPSVCNRLDRNTSGLILCGKSLTGAQVLSKLIQERSVRKLYHAVCLGELAENLDLDGFLTKNEKTNTVTFSKDSGDEAIRTKVHPLFHNPKLSLLEIDLITGKTHQIRAHLASCGHPLIGDPKYGNSEANKKYMQSNGIRFQMLHAYQITMPNTIERLPALAGKVFIADEPKSFIQIRKDQKWLPGIQED